jgi:hypothetical protein
MRCCLVSLLCLISLLTADAATGRVVKVLPHFLDLQGRHTLTPSLFDRDAYQAILRQHPEKRSALRFDIEWKSKGAPESPLKIRAQIRGVARENLPVELTLERTVAPAGWWGSWTSLLLKEQEYRKLGELTAWRVTLWDGSRLLGEQKSFLW